MPCISASCATASPRGTGSTPSTAGPTIPSPTRAAAEEDTLLAGHNGSLTLLLPHLGLMEQAQALQPGFFFRQGAYTAMEITAAGPGCSASTAEGLSKPPLGA